MSRTTEHLDESGIDYEVFPDNGQLQVLPDDGLPVRTVVLTVRTGHALAVLPAGAEIDVQRVREALDSRHVELATQEEIAADYPEFSSGSVPPLGSWINTPVVLDEQVTAHEQLVFEDEGQSVKVAGRDLFATAQIHVADICGA